MSNPTTPFGWQMPTATDLVTDLPADFEVFGQAVATSMGDLLGGTSGQVLAKNSNTDMDFVWVTSDDANAIQNTIVDAKGDLIAASANDTPARLAVGTSNKLSLQVDSTASTGLAWKQQGQTLISRTTFGSVSSQVFNSVFTTTYSTYLVIIEDLYGASATDDLHLQLRYGTTTQTAGYYGSHTEVDYLNNVTNTSMNNANQIILSRNVGDGVNNNFSNVYFQGVGVTKKPIVRGTGFDSINAATTSFGAKQETVSANYDGFLLKSSSGNIAGTVSIYGLAVA
jgi:hypothetical protein